MYDPKHVGTLCNYGTLLQEIRGDFVAAENYYRRALEIDPNHTITIYNYGMYVCMHVRVCVCVCMHTWWFCSGRKLL